MDASVGAMAANVMTAAAAAADLTTELQSGVATQALLTTVASYIDTEIAAIAAQIAAQNNLSAAQVRAELAVELARIDAAISSRATVAGIFSEVIEGSITLTQGLRLMFSALFGKSSGHATGLPIYRDMGDTKDRLTATVDADGNRTAVTRDGT